MAFPGAGATGNSLRALARRFLESAYSQDQELEADAFGVKVARAAGFDPAASIRVLRLLESLVSTEAGPGSYFSSHPPHELRIKNIEQVPKV